MTRALPRILRRLLIAVVIVVALVVIVRLLLDPIATAATRKGMAKMEGMKGDFERVHVTLFSPGYTITHLKIIEEPGGSWKTPIFYAEAVHVGVSWRRLFHGELVAAVRLVEPKIDVIAGKAPEKPKTPAKAPDLSEQLQKVTAFKIDRIEILRGELLFRDLAEPRHPELWIHDLELAAENIPTRARMAGSRPTTLSGRGTVGRSGTMTLFVSADPFASPLAFEGRFEMVGLKVAELFDFIEPKTKLQTPKGTVDLFAEWKSRGGRIEGGVKPVLKNVEVKPAESGAWDRVKAWLANKTVKAASDRVEGRNAVTTVVPIEGRLASPDIQLWPAVLGVIRNAFIEGLASGFAHLPPAKAPDEQGKLTQAKDALKKDKGPLKAQPTAGDKARAKK
jgi:hypothetical protein